MGSVRPSLLLSLWAFSCGIVPLAFSKFGLGARNPYEVVGERTGFFGKKHFLPQKLGKWTKNGSKTRFCEFIGKFGH